jgi:hypothetical protein
MLNLPFSLLVCVQSYIVDFPRKKKLLVFLVINLGVEVPVFLIVTPYFWKGNSIRAEYSVFFVFKVKLLDLENEDKTGILKNIAMRTSISQAFFCCNFTSVCGSFYPVGWINPHIGSTVTRLLFPRSFTSTGRSYRVIGFKIIIFWNVTPCVVVKIIAFSEEHTVFVSACFVHKENTFLLNDHRRNCRKCCVMLCET